MVEGIELDISRLSDDAKRLEEFLQNRIVGQDRAISQFVKVYQQIQVGLNEDDRPAGVFLFAGPTGTGKSMLCHSVAEYLFGNKNAITRIDCGEFQHEHEVAKLIGSPPGYVGYNEKDSIRLAQEKIDKFQTAEHKINILLLDEIEEAHDALLSAILQILDAGRLTLGNGNVTDFSKTIVVMTSNIGEKEMQQRLSGGGIGLKSSDIKIELADEDIYKAGKAAAKKHFKAKFMNRIDRLIVFRALNQESLLKILNIKLRDIQTRVWSSAVKKWKNAGLDGDVPIFRPEIRILETARTFLLKEGTSEIYGARELNRALNRFVVFPLGSLIGSGQIESDDIIELDWKVEDKKLIFRKNGKRDIKPLTDGDGGGAKAKDEKPTPSQPRVKLIPPYPIPPRKPAGKDEARQSPVWYLGW